MTVLAEDTLPSGRHVCVRFEGGELLVEVWDNLAALEMDRQVVRTSRWPFAKPLSERIREAVQRLDAAFDQPDDPHAALRQAAHDALYAGGPREEWRGGERQEPPLIFRPPPDPPPAPRLEDIDLGSDPTSPVPPPRVAPATIDKGFPPKEKR